jgi:hypothetical protein
MPAEELGVPHGRLTGPGAGPRRGYRFPHVRAAAGVGASYTPRTAVLIPAASCGVAAPAPCLPRQAGRCSRRQRCSSPNESGAFAALLDLVGCSSLIAPRQVAWEFPVFVNAELSRVGPFGLAAACLWAVARASVTDVVVVAVARVRRQRVRIGWPPIAPLVVLLETDTEAAAGLRNHARAALALAVLAMAGVCRVVTTPGSARAAPSPRFVTERVRAFDHPVPCWWRDAGVRKRGREEPAFLLARVLRAVFPPWRPPVGARRGSLSSAWVVTAECRVERA